mmetsp:Transcript_62040/g.192283  ORF Transcript_62040/g.192283 Transcript_62040/m.192283 type:complete len:493 (-) Transcript_62040:87-1565(-)
MILRGRSLAPALWLLVFRSSLQGAAAGPQKKKGNEVQVLMPHHSFAAPLEYLTLLDDWAVSGASVFEPERLLLHPGVAGLAGFLWSKSPLLTDNFEVVIHFRVMGEKQPQKVLHDQSFGFWYVHENISKVYNESAVVKAESWTKGMAAQGFTLGGAKALFDGLGVVLSMADREKKPRPSVSGFTNDGHTTLAWGIDVPTQDAKPIDFRNTLNHAQLKIRMRPDLVEGWVKQSPSLSWSECFSLDRSKHPIQAGGYIGVTAWSGTPEAGASADLVSIVQIDVTNMDENSIGEDMKDVSTQIQETYREMLTDSHRHFLDQKSQTDHISRLVDMLGEHVNATVPAEATLFGTLKDYEARMETLGEECRTMKKSVTFFLHAAGTKYSTNADHKAGVEAMKNDIIGLRRLLVKDSTDHKMRIEAVQKHVAEVKERAGKGGAPEALSVISRQADSLAKTVRSRGMQMSWMMICLLVAILGIGVLMWNRMRYYEKKHFI